MNTTVTKGAKYSNLDVVSDLAGIREVADSEPAKQPEEPPKSKYTNVGRVDLAMVELEKYAEVYDVEKFKKQEFMQYLSEADRKQITIEHNYKKLMDIRQNTIKDQFKPIDMYYEAHRRDFDTADIDLIDKAERYMDEVVTGRRAKKMARYETSEEILRLMKFVNWAAKRGGNAFNEAANKKLEDMTEEEKEQMKPFWERTYFTGSQPFKFTKKFINDYMKRADHLIKDNESAYHDYKKRALFPKINEKKQAYLSEKDKGKKPLGFIEQKEKELRDIYKVFLEISKQVRDDSYKLGRMDKKQ